MRHFLIYAPATGEVLAAVSTRSEPDALALAYPGAALLETDDAIQFARGMRVVGDAVVQGFVPPTLIEKRVASLAEGGYGTVNEQLEMLYDQGLDAWRQHISAVKRRYPKP